VQCQAFPVNRVKPARQRHRTGAEIVRNFKWIK